MEFNRENYEAYALDFLEGNLDSLRHQSFERFLARNEDIKATMDNFYMLNISPNHELVFEGKAALLRNRERDRSFLYWMNRAAVIICVIAAGLYGMNTWKSPNIPGDLTDGTPARETSIVSPSSTEPRSSDLVLAEALDTAKQELNSAVPDLSPKGNRVESEHAVVASNNSSPEFIEISDTLLRHFSIDPLPIRPTKRAVPQLALLPQRSFEYVKTDQNQVEVSIAMVHELRSAGQKKPSLFSGLFANLDLVPERYNRAEAGDLRSKLLPTSYFNK